MSWENIHQLAIITPADILEITAMVGKEVEELSIFLEKRFPGITQELATRYLPAIIGTFPEGSIPTLQEVFGFIRLLTVAGESKDSVRAKAVQNFYSTVNLDSPEYAKRAMMAQIEYALDEWVLALHSAGFAQCLYADPNFDEQMLDEDREEPITNLLNSERKKAEVLIDIIRELRLAA